MDKGTGDYEFPIQKGTGDFNLVYTEDDVLIGADGILGFVNALHSLGKPETKDD